ncbi:MAG: Hint domain-containing protein [Pseudomonadota bacterium]
MARFTLDWSATNIDGANTASASGQTTDYTVSTPANVNGQSWFLANFGGGVIGLAGQGITNPMVVDINFDEPVENLSFELFDVDAKLQANANGNFLWDDRLTIVALDADGNQVPVTFTDLAFHHDVNGNVLETDGNVSEGVENTGAADTVGVNIAGPIVFLQVIYDDGGQIANSGAVGISDIEFSTVAPDGYVEGDSGANTIDTGYDDDPDGDRINNNDAVLPGEGPQDDIVIAGGGDDTVNSAGGSDTVFGGEGADIINGAGGADIIYGDNPDFDGVLDFNDLATGDIVLNQYIESGVRVSSFNPDNQVMVFDSDNPTGGDADLGLTGVGNILILSEDGDSSDPDDNASGGTFVFEFIGPATVNSLDFVDQGTNTEIRLYDEDGNLLSEIDVPAGADNTLITQAINVSGVFRIEVTLEGGGAVTNLSYSISDAGGDGDTISGGGGADTIFGQVGDDTIDGGGGGDTIFGGEGQDTITGGGGSDTISGGLGSDLILGGTANDVVIGGEDPDDSDFDVLDLTGSDVDFVTFVSGDPEAGTVTFNDGSTMTFSEIERVIPCFTVGTMIATPAGEVAVEDLKEGDRVLTRDNGIQKVSWVGKKRLDHEKLKEIPELRPITIKAGAMGEGMPERDMVVSPSHRMLIVSELAQLYFDRTEVLVAAKHMLSMDGVEVSRTPYVTYVHFMCAHHEIVLADGAWSESFQPGDYTMKGFDAQQREEIFQIFPELQTKEGIRGYNAARRTLKRHEAKLLFTK